MKRRLWIILTLAALISALWCASAMAVVTTGPLGENVSYENDGSGTIRITGTGATNDYGSSYNLSPLDGNSMTAAVVEAGVTYLGNNVFYECANLASVTIKNPNAVISSTAFRVCPNLTTIYGWEGSTAATYADANGYTFQSLGSLTGNCGANGDNVTYSFDPATGTMTFSGTGEMTNYTLTDDRPWNGYSDLITSAVIQNGITVIGKNALAYCGYLVDVDIPESVVSMHPLVFRSCSSLTTVHLPSHLSQIPTSTFEYCNLDSITIPNSVTYIGLNAFNMNRLTSVSIPDSVTSIAMQAFMDNSKLRDVTIYNPKVSLGTNIFKECHASLTIHGWPDSTAQTYAQENGITFDAFETSGSCGDNLTWSFDASTGELSISGTGDMTVFGAATEVPWYNIRESVTSVNIGSGVTSISKRAFLRTGVTSVTIPANVTSVGFWAFRYCESLTSVTIMNPDCVIGDSSYDVFEGCASGFTLRGWGGSTAEVYAGNTKNPCAFESLGSLSGSCGENATYAYNPATGALTISGMGEMMDPLYGDRDWPWYSYRENITSVSIGSGVTSIGGYAFYKCTGLTNITIPGSVNTIGTAAFRCCASLTSVTIPSGVTKIGHYAFDLCTGLTSVTIPDSVTSIDSYAFSDCTSLTNITIPNDVTKISVAVFRNCTSLTSITIPNSVTIIDMNAFENCTSLNWVTIPNSVTKIDTMVFHSCTSLTAATVWNPDCVIGDSNYNVFRGCPSDFTLRGWAGSTAEAYSTNTKNPCGFELLAPAPDFFLPSALTSVELDAFVGISAHAVVIPRNIQSITGNPFAGSSVEYIYGFPGTAAEDLVNQYHSQFQFISLTDAWYSRLTH